MFFSSQCSPISNNIVLLSCKYFTTEKWLTTTEFNKDDIFKIIRNLNLNKVRGYNDISIRMLKICDSVVTEPSPVLLKNCVDCGIFPDIWKMPHIIPTYKKMINNI